MAGNKFLADCITSVSISLITLLYYSRLVYTAHVLVPYFKNDSKLKETALAGEYVSDLPPLPTLLEHSVLPVYARAGTGRN